MIEIKGVSKSYNGKIKAVDFLDMVVPSGAIVGFLWTKWSGKNNYNKNDYRNYKARSGRNLINGLGILDKPLAAKKEFGFVPDSPDIFLRLKGIEYLNFMADVYEVTASERKERINSLSQRFEMDSALSDQIQSYSHGMRQKIVLIGALLHMPSVWILDEPLTGLDPKSSYILKEMMREHAEAGKHSIFLHPRIRSGRKDL